MPASREREFAGRQGETKLTEVCGQIKIIFTGDIIDAREALSIGLLNRVVPASELRSTVMELALKIAGKGAFSLKMAKRAIQIGQEVGLTPGLAFEALGEVAWFTSPDKEEGIDAFFEKRKPQFHK